MLAERRAQKSQQKIREATNPGDLDLLDFIPALNPRMERPEHLAPVADLFKRLEAGPIRALVSMPPQHGKTSLIINGVARLLRRKPWLRCVYASFADRRARKPARECRDLAMAAGVELREDAHAVNDWMTVQGGGLLATGIGGALTGNPADGVLVIDDPHKDREEAESALEREKVYDWWSSTAKTRLHPSASVVVVHTRWHPDDLIGRLSKETKTLPDGTVAPAWEIINLPAIDDAGRALWHMRPLSFLEEQRRGNEYDWWSLWMGSPRPRGDSLFRGVKFYDGQNALPKKFRCAGGVDLAYTAKTRADSSCAVVLIEADGLYYVVDVRRAQCEVPEFARTLAALQVSHPVRSWHWFCSTTEKGVAQLVTADGVTVEPVLATADKFVRAQPVATAWNEGRVLVSKDAPWLKAFVDELGAFTGVSDRHDDQVDALASAFESLRSAEPTPILAPTKQTPQLRWGSTGRGF